MSAQPTPGVLTVRAAANGDVGIIAPGDVDPGAGGVDIGGLLIAECYADIRRPGERAAEEAMANARQFAVAPRLLAVLELLFDRDCQIYAHEITIPMRSHADATKALFLVRRLLAEAKGAA